MQILRKIIINSLLITSFCFSYVAMADNTDSYLDEAQCPNAHILENIIKSVCWDCIFPIYVAGVKVDMSKGSGNGLGKSETSNIFQKATYHNAGVPSSHYDKALCTCQEGALKKPGLIESMWEPARMIEFPRAAGCFPVLGGKLNIGDAFDVLDSASHARNASHARSNMATHGGSFRHYHMYAFPVLQIMGMFSEAICTKDAYVDLDVIDISEINPTWHDKGVATYATPEAVLIAAMNVAAEVACLPETTKTTANSSPDDSLFWCAGNWGTYYPLVGNLNDVVGQIRESSYISARALALLHRSGREFGTAGKEYMCSAKTTMYFPKTQWKFQHIHPITENGTHVLGFPFIAWENGLSYPSGAGTVPIYMLFRWNDCCNTEFASGAN